MLSIIESILDKKKTRYLLPRVYLPWLPIAVGLTLAAGMVYVAVQQSLRLGANALPVELAQDAKAALEQGRGLGEVLPPGPSVAIERSLAPFVIVYDDSGKPLISSGKLDGEDPRLPQGVLDYTRSQGENRVTWQPRPGVRVALVVERYEKPNPGFLAAGRSLREVEVLISAVGNLVLLGWIAGMLASFIMTWVVIYRREFGTKNI